MYYVDFLEQVHRQLKPRTYLEIGVASGRTVRLAEGRAVGVDPAFQIRWELNNDIALVRSTSDEFFSRPDPLQLTGGRPFDLSFIDGLHLFEFAFRDFINVERHSSTRGMIVIDDVLPRSVDEAARLRHTSDWTGDIYPMIAMLAQYRPDLVVVPVDTRPTGLLVVFGLDPSSTVLSDRYEEILAEHRRADPQPVPADVLDRLTVHPADRFLSTGVLASLAEANDTDRSELHDQLRGLVHAELGPGYLTAG